MLHQWSTAKIYFPKSWEQLETETSGNNRKQPGPARHDRAEIFRAIILHTLYFTLCMHVLALATLYPALHCPHSTLPTVRLTIGPLDSTLHLALYTLHPALNTPHYTVFALHTLHSMPRYRISNHAQFLVQILVFLSTLSTQRSPLKQNISQKCLTFGFAFGFATVVLFGWRNWTTSTIRKPVVQGQEIVGQLLRTGTGVPQDQERPWDEVVDHLQFPTSVEL